MVVDRSDGEPLFPAVRLHHGFRSWGARPQDPPTEEERFPANFYFWSWNIGLPGRSLLVILPEFLIVVAKKSQ